MVWFDIDTWTGSALPPRLVKLPGRKALKKARRAAKVLRMSAEEQAKYRERAARGAPGD